MIRTVADNTPNPVLTALYSRRDNARAAAKRIFREDEFRIEPAEGGKFRVVLAGEGKPASGKPAIDPGGVIAAIKDECGEVTVDSRTILPKTASEKAAEKRVRMRVIAGGKPKAEDAAGAACLLGAAKAAREARPLDELGDLSTQGTGLELQPVPAGMGAPLGELLADQGAASGAATAGADGLSSPEAGSAPADAPKPSAPIRRPPMRGTLGELTEQEEDVALKLFGIGHRKGLNARPQRADIGMFPMRMFRDVLRRLGTDLSDTERAAAESIAARGEAAPAASEAADVEAAAKGKGKPKAPATKPAKAPKTAAKPAKTKAAKQGGAGKGGKAKGEAHTPEKDAALLKSYGTAKDIVNAIRKAPEGMSYADMRTAFGWKGVGLSDVVRAASRVSGVALEYRFINGPRDGRWFIAEGGAK